MNDSDEDFESKFQMQTPTSTARTPGAAGRPPTSSGGQQQQGLPAYPGVDADRVARETEAKCSQLLADAEHRVMDERSRLQNVMSTSSMTSRGTPKPSPSMDPSPGSEPVAQDAAQQKVQALLASFRAGVANPVASVLKSDTRPQPHVPLPSPAVPPVSSAGAGAAGDDGGAFDAARVHSSMGAHRTLTSNAGGSERFDRATAHRVKQLEQDLAERDQQMQAMEAKHASEKKELLSLRTHQLKLESSRKGQEGEMVNRAIATIAEYEAAVRKSESENATRLSNYIDRFTQDWLNRAREFEEAKGNYEADMMEKAFAILREQEQILTQKEEAVRKRIIEALGQQSRERHGEEQQMLEQFERFKMEYKALQDRDYETRCSMFDEGFARRETALFEKLSEERVRLIERERTLAESGERSQGELLNEAMQQVTNLREQVLADAQQKQDEFYTQLIMHREGMQKELVEHEKIKAEQIADMQARVIDAMNDANQIVMDIKKQMAEAEHQSHQKYLTILSQRQQEMEAEQTVYKERLEGEYFEKLRALTDSHGTELKRISEEHLAQQHDASSAAFKREQEIRMASEAKIERLEEQIGLRYQRELQDARDANVALQDTVHSLQQELAALASQLQTTVETAKGREAKLEAKIAAARREAGEAKLTAEKELQERHDQWLEKALGEAHRSAVDQIEYERMRRELDAADARCLDLIRKEREAMNAAKEQVKEDCQKRLDEERERLQRVEADLLEKVADMRVELEAEARRKEAANQRFFDTERKNLYEEATERAAADRRERQEYEETLRASIEARYRTVNGDIVKACDDRIASMQAAIDEKEGELSKEKGRLHEERMALQQQQAMQAHKQEQDEYMVRSQLVAELRQEAEVRLQTERERLQGELENIRKQAAEQQRAVDENRVKLQRQFDEDRAKFERETSTRYQRLMEQTIDEHNRMVHQREEAEQQREVETAERHRRAMHDVQTLHAQEMDRVNAKLQQTRCDFELERAEVEQDLKAMFQKREDAVRADAQAMVRAEQEALRHKELQMASDNDRIRLEAEAAARETMQRMFDHRQKQWEAADEERRQAAVEFFAKMKAIAQEKDDELLRRQKKFEEETRRCAEQALEEQRIQLKSAHAAEATRLAQENAQLRTQLAKCPSEREAEEDQRRVVETHERQLKDERTRHAARLAEVAQEWEAKLAVLRTTLNDEREAAQLAALRKGEELAIHQQETGRKLQDKMDALLVELRSMYERKWRQLQEQDLEKAAAFDRQKMEYEERVKKNYEDLLKDAEKHYHDALEARGKQRSEHDRERDALIQKLRHEIDAMKVHEMDEVEAKVRQRAEELQSRLLDDRKGFTASVKVEKELREEAERAAAGLKQELEALANSMNQWKLDLHKSLVAKYEALFNEVQSRARKDREMFAHKLLEEEERRLARELARKDADMTRSRNEAERNAAMECEEREWKAQSVDLQHRMKRLFDAFGSKREKLTKLWSVIDTDPGEKVQLLDGIFEKLAMLSALPPSTASPEVDTKQSELEMAGHMSQCVTLVYEEVCNEVQRLEAQLPLMDVITRREFVKHRLREVLALPPSPARDKQVMDLRRELQLLDAQLLHDLPKYEQTHNAKLFYKNRRYLHVMEQELQQMQQDAAAAGVVLPHPQMAYTATPAP